MNIYFKTWWLELKNKCQKRKRETVGTNSSKSTWDCGILKFHKIIMSYVMQKNI